MDQVTVFKPEAFFIFANQLTEISPKTRLFLEQRTSREVSQELALAVAAKELLPISARHDVASVTLLPSTDEVSKSDILKANSCN